MFASFQDIIVRHRKKCVAIGIIVGGSYFVYKLVRKQLHKFQDQEGREFFERSQRREYHDAQERNCNNIIIGLSIDISKEIVKLTNNEDIIEKLRENPDNKIELWEELKVVTFTRISVIIYAMTILTLTLRIQMSLIGGYVYKDTVSKENKITEEIREAYLGMIKFYLTEGIVNLVRVVKTKTRDIMKKHSLDSVVTLPDVEQMFWAIQFALEKDKKNPKNNIAWYVMAHDNPHKGKILSKMYYDTLDLLDSDDVLMECTRNISLGFSHATSKISKCLEQFLTIDVKDEMNEIVTNIGGEPMGHEERMELKESKINEIELPLAKMIPILNGMTANVVGSTIRPQRPEHFATAIVSLNMASTKCRVIAENIYEAFSV